VIDNIRRIDSEASRNNNKNTRLGLYIELKNYHQNLNFTGLDMADLLNQLLTENGLNTVDACSSSMPIIVQSFELPAL